MCTIFTDFKYLIEKLKRELLFLFGKKRLQRAYMLDLNVN